MLNFVRNNLLKIFSLVVIFATLTTSSVNALYVDMGRPFNQDNSFSFLSEVAQIRNVFSFRNLGATNVGASFGTFAHSLPKLAVVTGPEIFVYSNVAAATVSSARMAIGDEQVAKLISYSISELNKISPLDKYALVLGDAARNIAVVGNNLQLFTYKGHNIVELAVHSISPNTFSSEVLAYRASDLASSIPRIAKIDLPTDSTLAVNTGSVNGNEGMVLGAFTTAANVSSKNNLPFLDQLSLSLYCSLSSLSTSLDKSRCNYDLVASGLITSPVANANDTQSKTVATNTNTNTNTQTPAPLTPTFTGSVSPTYITQYITKYIPVAGPAGADGRDGKDGVSSSGALASNIGFGAFINPTNFSQNSSPSFTQSLIGVSTIGYLKDTTIDYATLNHGTSTNLYLANASLSGAVFNGSNTFNGLASFTGTVNVNEFTAASSTLTNSTTTNAYIANLSIGSSTISGAASFGSDVNISGALSVVGTSTLATTTITTATIGDLAVTNSSTTNATSTNFIATNATSTNLEVTNGSTTNSFITNGTTTNSFVLNGTTTNLAVTNASTTNATTTNSFISSLFATLANITDLIIGNATTTNFAATNASTTNLTALFGTTTNSFTENATTTNGFFTNLIATLANITDLIIGNSTTTNAIVQNSTTTNAYIQNLSIGTSSSNGSISINGNLNVNGTSTLATTTTTSFTATQATTTSLYATYGTTVNGSSTNFFTQNLSVGSGQVAGNQSINGNLTVNGSTTLGNNTLIQGSVTLGTSTSNYITVNGLFNSNLVPSANVSYDLGSPSFYWRNGYLDSLTVNHIYGTALDVSSTNSSTFTVNSDNATVDGEDASLVFFRGLVTPNAVIRWNSVVKRLESNMSLRVMNETPVNGTTTLTIQGGAGQGTTNLFELVDNSGNKMSAFDATGRLGIGTSTPLTSLHIVGTDAIVIPVGTTAQRPTSSTTGMIRYNSSNTTFEGFNGTTWGSLGGVIDTNQDTYVSAENSPGANNDELKFFTFGEQRGVFSSNGNFGIGTTTPGSLFSVNGNSYFGGNIYATGTLNILGNTILTNASTTGVTATSVFSTNVFASTSVLTIASSTALTATTLYSTLANITNASTTGVTATNIFTTNLYASSSVLTNASTTGVTATNLFSTNVYASTSVLTNASTTGITVNRLFGTSVYASSSVLTNASTTGITATRIDTSIINASTSVLTNASTTGVTAINLFSTNVFASTSVLTLASSTGLTATNLYFTNASSTGGLTITNLFSTGIFASTSVLTLASSTALTATTLYSTLANITNASTTGVTATNIFTTNLYASSSVLTNASSTGVTATNLYFTNASSTGGLTVPALYFTNATGSSMNLSTSATTSMIFTSGILGTITSGPNQAAAANTVTGTGTVAWSTPTNGVTSDNIFATVALNNAASNFLVATSTGFAIPNGTTITGILVEFEKKVSAAGSTSDGGVYIVKGGVITGTNKADGTTAWTTSDNVYTSYGGQGDLWGTSWTAADINSGTFGAAIAGRKTAGGNTTFSVDAVRITVYYTYNSTSQWVTGVGDATAGDGGKYNISRNGDLSSSYFTINTTGNVGVGSSSPYYGFVVDNATSSFRDILPATDISYVLGTSAKRFLNLFSQNIYASSSQITNSSSTALTATTLYSTLANITNASTTGVTATNIFSTNVYASTSILTLASSTGLTATNLYFTNASSTGGLTLGNLFATNLYASTSVLTNASTTNITSGGMFYGNDVLIGTTTPTYDAANLVVQGTSTFIGTPASPTAIRAIGNIDNTATSSFVVKQIGSTASFGASNNPYAIAVAGNYAYVTLTGSCSPGNILAVVDVTIPTSPVLVSTTTVGSCAQGISVFGRYAYIANTNSSTISIVDISNPKAPTVISSPSAGANPYGIYVSGGYAYVPNFSPDALTILDISNPRGVVTVATTSTGGTFPHSVYVSGKYAYVVNYNSNTMSVIDVSNPAAPVLTGTTTTGVNPGRIYVSGRYAYITNEGTNTVTIIDIASSTAPSAVSTATVGFFPAGIYVSGRYAYISAQNALNVVDISNPSSPVTVSSTTVANSVPVGVFVSGRYAYTANSGNAINISVFDLGGLETTSAIVHSLEAGNLSVRNDIFANGNISGSSLTVGIDGFQSQGNSSVAGNFKVGTSSYPLFFANAGLNRVNIGTSTGAATLFVQGTSTANPFTVAASSSLTYFTILANGNVGVGSSTPYYGFTVDNATSSFRDILPATDISYVLGTNAKRFLNLFSQNIYASSSVITNASSTGITTGTLYSTTELIGTTTPTFDSAKLVVQGTSTFVGTTASPTAIRAIGNIDNTATSTFNPKLVGSLSLGGSPYKSYVLGKYMYVANNSGNSLQIVDISNPTAPILTGSLALGVAPYNVYVSGRYAYLDGNSGITNYLTVVDVTEPNSPVLVAQVSPGVAFSRGMTGSGNYAFVSTQGSLTAFDVTNPKYPVVTSSIGSLGDTEPGGMVISGNYLYFSGSQSSVLRIIDISNPKGIRQVGSVAVNTNPTGLYVSGHYAYVSNTSTTTMQIIDIASSTAPSVVGSVVTGTSPYGVFVSGRYAYQVNNGSNTFSRIDVSSSTNPFVVNTFTTSTGPSGIYVVGRYAYVTHTNGTLQVVDLGGTETTSALIHSLEAGNLQVNNDILAQGMITARTGLLVGYQGFQSQGASAVNGNFSVGTSSYPLFFANAGLNRVNIGTSTGAATLFVQGTSTANPFTVAASSSLTYFTILANGNVGVGSSTPNYGFVVDNATSSFRDILPATDISYVLGTSAKRFLNLFSQNIYASSSVITNASTTGVTATNLFSTNVYASSSVLTLASSTALTATTLYSTLANITNASTTGVTATNIFTTNLYASSSVLTNASSTGITTGTLYSTTTLVGTTTTALDSAKLVVQGTSTFVGNSTSPTAMRVIGNIDNTPSQGVAPKILGTFSGISGNPLDLAVQGNYAYMTSGGTVFYTVDISNRASPVLVSTTSVPSTSYFVAVSGKYAYTSGLNVITVLDISNASSTVTVSSTTVPSTVTGLEVSGNYLYASTGSGGTIYVLDISNAAYPRVVSSIGGQYGTHVYGSYAYSLGTSYTSVINVSNPVKPVLASTTYNGGFSTASFGHFFVSGHYAYLPTGFGVSATSYLTIIDVTNPASPFMATTSYMGSNAASDGAIAVAGAGRYVYVANYNPGDIKVVDVSVPTNPVIVGNIATGARIRQIVVSGRYLYYTVEGTGFRVVDLGGLETTSAIVHSLEAGNLSVRNDIFAAGNVTVGTGLNIGNGGFLSQGNSAVNGNFTVGTSSYPLLFADAGLNRVNIGTSTGAATLFVQGTSTANPFIVASSTGSSLLTVLANGFVGVGTSTPSQLFTVGDNNQFSVSATGSVVGQTLTIGANSITPVIISGTVSPAVNGSYAYAGQYNGKNYYQLGTEYVWYRTGANQWIIGDTLGGAATPLWYVASVASLPPTGAYTAFNGATGAASLANAALTYFTVDASGNTTAGNGMFTGTLSASTTLAVTSTSTLYGVLNMAADILPISDITRSIGNNALRFLNLFSQNIYASSSVITNASTTNITSSGTLYGTTVMIGTTTPTFDSAKLVVQGTSTFIGTTASPTAIRAIGNIDNTATSTFIPKIIASTTTNSISSIAVQGKYAYIVSSASGTIQVVDVSNPTSPLVLSTTTLTTNATGVMDILVSGRYAYIRLIPSAGGNGTIYILDISDPVTPVVTFSGSLGINQIGTVTEKLAISGKYLYFNDWGTSLMKIFDVSNPYAPVQVGSVSHGGTFGGIDVLGKYAYLYSTFGGGLRVIDVSNPTAPAITGTLALGGFPGSVTVSGRYAYVPYSTTLSVVDISSSTLPVLRGTVTINSNSSKVYVSGRYVYSLAGTTLQVIDVASSTAPRVVSTLSSLTAPSGFAVSGHYAYYGDGTSFNVLDLGGVETTSAIVHSLEAGNLVVRDNIFANGNTVTTGLTVGTAGFLSQGYSSIYGSFAVTGTSTFSTTTTSLLNVAGDILPTSNIVRSLGTNALRFLNLFSQNIYASSSVMTYATSTNFAAVNASSTNLFAYNASTTNITSSGTLYGTTVMIGTTTPTFDSAKLVVQGTSTFIGTTASPTAIRAIGNIDNTATSSIGLKLISTWASPSSTGLGPQVVVQNNYAYFVDNNITFYTVDVTNKSAPLFVSSTTIPSGSGIGSVSGKYAYLTNGANLTILDISNASSTVTVSSTTLGFTAGGIALSGNYLYVGGAATMSVFDVSSPAYPRVVSTLSGVQAASGMRIYGKYAYSVSRSGSYMSIVDISNPTKPTIASTTVIGSSNNVYGNLYVSGRYAFVQGGNADFVIVDISNPSAPIVATSSYVMGGLSSNLTGNGKYIYVSSYNPGDIAIVDVSSPTTPVLVSTTRIGSGLRSSLMIYGRNLYYGRESGLNGFGIMDIGGLETTSALVHSLEAGNLSVRNDIFAAGNVTVGTGLSIGNGGFLSQGNSAVNGNFTVGTSSYPLLFADAGLNRVNIGTSTGAATLFVQGTSTANPFVVASSTGTSLFTILANGNVGIGTSSPVSLFSVLGTSTLNGAVNIGTTTSTGMLTLQATSGVNLFNFNGSAGTPLLTLNSAGALLFGTTTYAGLQGEIYANFLTTASTTATTTLAGNLNVGSGGIVYDASSTVTSISSLEIGNMSFDTNAGIISWTDLPVTSAAATGTVESYTAQIGGSGVLTVYSESNGIGGTRYPRIGINTATPGSALDVYTATSTSNVDLFRLISDVGSTANVKFRVDSDGDIFTDGGTTVGSPADIAENYTALEAVDAGTVVAFGTTTENWNQVTESSTTTDVYAISGVRKAAFDYEAVGIVSTKAGITLGGNTTNGVSVAFVGRVPVKVTTENGVVARGDYLTVSKTIPGYAMKLTGEGRAIGRAISDYETGKDKVMVLVENGYQRLDLAGKTATTSAMLTTGNLDLNANGVAITNIKSLASANGSWSIDENGRIVAKVLCLEDVCIDKTQLTNILNNTGTQGMVAGTSTNGAAGSQQSTTNSTSTTDTGTTTPPTGGDPVIPPVDPVIPPTDPVVPPADPVTPPVEPVVPSTDPVTPPADPVLPPTDVPPTTP